MTPDDRFQELLTQAESFAFEGWNFSAFEARVQVDPDPWDYTARVEALASDARSMADLGTGGGEFLVGLKTRPPLTVATEGWIPNVAVADRNLRPIGVHVIAVEGAPDNAAQRFLDLEGRLPFCSDSLDLVVDRHEAFRATEVARVLGSGGHFLTQQVGSRNEAELNDALGGIPPCLSPTLDEYVEQIERAGLRVVDAQEAFPTKRYLDVGAVVMFLSMIPWQYEGFDASSHRDDLRAIHEVIEREGAFEVHIHRFLLEAMKP